MKLVSPLAALAAAALVTGIAGPRGAGAQDEQQRRPAPRAAQQGQEALPKEDIGTAMRVSDELKKAKIAQRGATSYAPVALETSFDEVRQRLSAEKDQAMRRQQQLLESRYDLSDRPSADTRMSRGKPIQEGVRVKLPSGVNWEQLATMSPDEIRERDVFPAGFLPLPHPKHEEGGMVFPKMQIDEIKRQEDRDLTRFDVDFDIPEHFLPEFPPAIYLTTRPDLGDVSQGQLVTNENFFKLFNGILTPKQLDGLRLLLTPFPQQQFNFTEDRRSDEPHRGVACFDCRANGHTNASTHLVGDIRPQHFRHRIDTPSLRGEEIFFGKGQCGTCHIPPFYTDNLMHNLQAERFYTARMINGRAAAADGPIKTFPLRGIKESPPYLHDGRLLTLADTVEFFNLVLGVQLNQQEKQDLVAFLKTL